MTDRAGDLNYLIVIHPEEGLRVACLNWWEDPDAYYPRLCPVRFRSEEDAQAVVDGIYAHLGRVLAGRSLAGG